MKSSRFVALPILAICATAGAQNINLGAASNYSVFGLGDTSMTMSSGNTRVNGNVGLASGSHLDFSGGGIVNGGVFSDSGVNIHVSGNSQATGGFHVADLSQAANDAISASNNAASLTANMDLNSITNSTGTINAAGNLTVIKVDGNVHLSGGGSLTLNGNSHDFFVLNIYGGWETSGGSKTLLTGGLTANHVLYNFVGSGGSVNFSGNSQEDGTFLAVDRSIVDSGGVVNGALIGARGHSLTLQSGPKINGQPVPEPMSMLALASGGLIFLRRKRKLN